MRRNDNHFSSVSGKIAKDKYPTVYENLSYTVFSVLDPEKFIQDPDPIFQDIKD
jgi:hypothetical protein